VAEAGCLAHARRKFHELWANHKSPIGEQALALFGRRYEIEREVAALDLERRRTIRPEKARPVADALRTWLTAQRQKAPPGSATAKAIDYTLGRWPALTRYVDDGDLPADNNWVENRIRPIAIGRSNWLFAGSLRAGKRGAAVMSLIHSARINGHDPYAYVRDVLERLPTQRASQIGELLPHRWTPARARTQSPVKTGSPRAYWRWFKTSPNVACRPQKLQPNTASVPSPPASGWAATWRTVRWACWTSRPAPRSRRAPGDASQSDSTTQID
jgi:hypothetical protein